MSPRLLRLRPDLVFQRQDGARRSWVVKDPVSLRYFLFGGDERFLLERLDGQRTAEELVREFERERAPRRLTMARLQSFLNQLHRDGLTLSDAPQQSRTLLERADAQRRRAAALNWTNALAIRFPGVNPEPFLAPIFRLARPFLSPTFFALGAAMAAAATAMAWMEADALSSQWPRAADFLQGGRVVWLAAALGAAKAVHELAHALVCKRFGGRCHEMGFMLLAFTPALYCNVTDAWSVRGRYQRMAISAAGIVAELFLASLALFAWRFSQPGAFHSICLSIVVVCSVNTLLFNGNPLLKYDGYYVLSDWLQVPNLWQESRSYLASRLDQWLYRRRGAPQQFAASGALLGSYAVASIAYRWALWLSIGLFLYHALHPLGLDLVLVGLAALAVGRAAVLRWSSLARWLRNPSRWEGVRTGVWAFLGGAAGAAAMAFAFLPLPCSVVAPAVLQPRAATQVFVATPGTLVDAIQPGARIAAGATLATLESAELEQECLRLDSEISRMAARVESLTARQSDEPGTASQLVVARELLADLHEQRRLRREEQSALVLQAPVAGVVIGPPAAPPMSDSGAELPAWSGSPMDVENRGCFLERGAHFCTLGDPQRLEAVAFVDETDVRYVRADQEGELRLRHASGESAPCRVVEIAEINAATAPKELTHDRDMAIRLSRDGDAAPLRTLYQVRLAAEPSASLQVVNARAWVRISVQPQTLAHRLVRWVRKTLTTAPPT